MRVLLITDNHTPTGGAENYFFDLKERLKTIPGLTVYSLGFGPVPTRGDDFVIFKRLKTKLAKFIWQLVLHPVMYLKLRKAILRIQPDIIHLHNFKQYTASLLPAIQSFPVVQTLHDYSVICPTAQNLHQNLEPCSTGWRLSCLWQHQIKYHSLSYLALTLAFLINRRRLKKIVNTFFAPSPMLLNYLKQNHFTPATCIVPFKKEFRQASFHTLKPHHFLFAGTLGAHKGIYILLEEFALAHKSNPQLTLSIAGTGPDEKHIRLRIQALGLEKSIQLIGWQENPEHEYGQCAALIFPSLGLETFGLVMSEAMHHARPVIGSNRGTPPWVIDDQETGFLFNPLKKGDLADKILKLAGNPSLLHKLGINGQKKLETFMDNKKMLEKIVKNYKDII